MDRRNFVGSALAGGALMGAAAQAQQPARQFSERGGGSSTDWHVKEIFVERKQSGKPHQGKMLGRFSHIPMTPPSTLEALC